MEKSIFEKACSTPGCGKGSTLQCPTCVKLNLPPSFFCSQECFKNFWPIHKFMHLKDDPKKEEKKDKYKYTGPLRPGKVSPRLSVPENIKKPDYAISGIPQEEINNRSGPIEVKSKEEIDVLREVCILGRKTLDYSHSLVRPGITTDEIDKKTHQFIIDNLAYPSPLNYHGFPKSLCTSVNEVICHGIPDDRALEEGDIVNCDITVYQRGYHADLNETYCVGKVSDSSKFLIEKTYEALAKAIEICKPGTMYREVGNVIGKYCEDNGLSVVRTYTGHGLGRLFHCDPNVPHYANNKASGFMKVGHVFTIEPMVNQGTWKDQLWPDNWTAVTQDGQRSAQFEHTMVVTEGGVEVLTQRLPDSPPFHWKV